MMLTAILGVATVAVAEKPEATDVDQSTRVACGLNYVCWTWNGAFTTEVCDATGGAPVWQYGPVNNAEVPDVDCDGNPLGSVLGTVLNGDYPNNAGERAILGTFTVANNCNLLEICHFYDIENSFDGGNVEINVGGSWTVISPMGGYPDDLISDSASYYAFCVDMEPGFTDGPTGFVRDCFDLSAYVGQAVTVAVTFGSDSSVVYPGWYIAGVWAGGIITPTEEGNWSTIKGLY
jgi:hypothetical protein